MRDLTFSYGGDSAPVLENINLQVARGEILVVVGSSGCGKSTLLNLVAGIVRPCAGHLECGGLAVKGLNRRVTYMTQKDTLLPWRKALDNAALPLEIKGVGKRERYARAREALARVGLANAEHRRPHQMSGGMRSRLSLARLLLSDASIVLMDEPFAAVDALVRVRLQQLLIDLWQETRKTILYVTHDLEEAVTLGHRVIVMKANPGRISLEQAVAAPHPRDVVGFRKTPEAELLHSVLWQSLEHEVSA